MRKFVEIVILFLTCGCGSGGVHEEFTAAGLAYGESHSCMLFTTFEDGIIGGRYSKSTTPAFGEEREAGKEYNDALCWVTHDGGRNWKNMKVGDGEVRYLIEQDKRVYAIVHRNSIHGTISVLHVFQHKGNTWRKQSEVEGIISCFHVIDSNRMFFWGGRDDYQLHETRDGGKTWIVYKNQYDGIEEVFFDGSIVYYLTHVFDRSRPGLLVKKDLNTGEEKVLPMPSGQRGKKGFGNVVSLDNNNKLELYRINNDSLVYLTTFDYGRQYLDFFAQQGNKAYACLRVHRGGALTPEKMIIFSNDGGKTWDERVSSISLQSDCVSAHGEGDIFKLWYYGGNLSIGTYQD